MRALSLLFVVWGSVAAAQAGFEAYAQSLANRAISQGIPADVVREAFSDLRYNSDVVFRDRNQAEFVRPLDQYIAAVVSDTQVKDGQRALRRNRRVLEQIEAQFGVDAEVVAAVWGVESRYGARRGEIPVMEALVTLAYDGRRRKLFEAQVFAALRILNNGDVAADDMTGSWAGAMGHTQFIPTSYEAYAVDFTGDGKRQIWGKDPSDALASTAAYLKRFGWKTGQPWGVEVKLPDGFDRALARRSIKRKPADWARLGVRGIDGRPVPNYGRASLLLPGGDGGLALMIFDNFQVLERYNASDKYVIAVGHLSDRLRGGAAFERLFPDGERALTQAERFELQRLLVRRGYDTGGIDGRLGSKSRAAIRAFEAAAGHPVTGAPSLEILKALRRSSN